MLNTTIFFPIFIFYFFILCSIMKPDILPGLNSVADTNLPYRFAQKIIIGEKVKVSRTHICQKQKFIPANISLHKSYNGS